MAIEPIDDPVEFASYFQSAQEFELPVLAANPIITPLQKSKQQVVAVVQMVDPPLGYLFSQPTLAAMVGSNFRERRLATAIVASQTFANVNNDGVLLDPGPVGDSMRPRLVAPNRSIVD